MLAEHPVGRWVGWDRLRAWSARLRDNAGNWGTSISLGFMLGMVPAFGRFFGLPLDVRIRAKDQRHWIIESAGAIRHEGIDERAVGRVVAQYGVIARAGNVEVSIRTHRETVRQIQSAAAGRNEGAERRAIGLAEAQHAVAVETADQQITGRKDHTVVRRADVRIAVGNVDRIAAEIRAGRAVGENWGASDRGLAE